MSEMSYQFITTVMIHYLFIGLMSSIIMDIFTEGRWKYNVEERVKIPTKYYRIYMVTMWLVDLILLLKLIYKRLTSDR